MHTYLLFLREIQTFFTFLTMLASRCLLLAECSFLAFSGLLISDFILEHLIPPGIWHSYSWRSSSGPPFFLVIRDVALHFLNDRMSGVHWINCNSESHLINAGIDCPRRTENQTGDFNARELYCHHRRSQNEAPSIIIF